MVNFIFCEVPVFHFLVSGQRAVFRFHTFLQTTEKFRNKANLKSEKRILFTLNYFRFFIFLLLFIKAQCEKSVRKWRKIFKVLITDKNALRISLYPVCWKMRTRITPNTDTFYAVKRKEKQIFLVRFYMFFRARKLIWILYLKLPSRSPGGGM